VAPDGPSSPRDPRLAAARRLVHRHQREKTGRFLAEGPQAVREALRYATVHEVFVADTAQDRHEELVQAATAAGVAVQVRSEAELESLSETVTPQGLVAVCDQVAKPWGAADLTGSQLVVVLVEARDPGNVGTIIRVADAAGADAVVLTAGSVDPHNGKCVRASAGSLFHLPVLTGVPVAATVAALSGSRLQVLAADATGADIEVDDELGRPTAWLFGNEAHGLPPELVTAADRVVAVPIHGKAESLNLSTAAAVCLYASARQLRR
jgi:TrmH family RNA methyltransferase